MRRALIIIGLVLTMLAGGMGGIAPPDVHARLNTIPVWIQGPGGFIVNTTESGGLNIITTTWDEHQSHLGLSYIVSRHVASLGSSATIDLLINTPADSDVHFFGAGRCSGECNIILYEDTIVSAVGTSAPLININRQSSNTADTVVTHTPTVTGVGTLIQEAHFGSGQTKGGEVESDKHIVLKPSSLYLVRLTSEASANDAQLSLSIIEGNETAP